MGSKKTLWALTSSGTGPGGGDWDGQMPEFRKGHNQYEQQCHLERAGLENDEFRRPVCPLGTCGVDFSTSSVKVNGVGSSSVLEWRQ